MEEKRVHPRVSVSIEVICERAAGPSVKGVVTDLSVGGMFVESGATMSFGDELTVVVTFSSAEGPVRLPAVVRWTKPGGFGVQFGLLGARETHALTNMMRR
ncbi:MAG: PilZ domain-containing protein [Sorangiineae bacterium]|nr:PilZ domain-containing protein [Polyangiaceae bacterium]MEB2322635.1 PilZ domain-containing protein [Sorangiineae bacterium]